MKYNYVGNTGLMVSELCFGTMTFRGQEAGMWNNIGQLQQKEVNQMLEAVIDSSINFIDTADIYSFGQAEQLLGQAATWCYQYNYWCKEYRTAAIQRRFNRFMSQRD